MLGKFMFETVTGLERRACGLSVSGADVEGGRIRYNHSLTGSKPIAVLLHGFGADRGNWNRMARMLRRTHRVVVPDLPGFGDSSKDAEVSYAVEEQVERLHAFLESVLGGASFSLAGNSMGGYIAGAYAAAHPASVESVWLFAPLGVQRAAPSPMFEAVARGERAVVLATSRSEYDDLLDAVFVRRPFVPKFLVDGLAARALEDTELHGSIFHQIHRIEGGHVTFSQPLEEVLVGYPGRVLVVWGDGDVILNPDGARVLAEVLPEATVEVWEGIGHLPMMEDPSRAACVVQEFEGV